MLAEYRSDGPLVPRRHDIDALRTGALLLLIVYHAAISFQGIAPYIAFPQNQELLEYYRSNFNRHKKYYLAIVEGEIGNDFSFKHFIDY